MGRKFFSLRPLTFAGLTLTLLSGCDLFDLSSPFAAPDRVLLFDSDRGGSRQVYAMRANDPTSVRALTSTGENQQPAACRVGSLIAFTSNRDGSEEIFTLDLATDELLQRTDGGGVAREPALSPDCGELIFVRDDVPGGQVTSLRAVPLDGGAERILYDGLPPNVGGDIRWHNPTFNPAGDRIAADTNFVLFHLRPDGGEVGVLVPVTAVDDREPAYSEDGTQLAWSELCGPEIGLTAIMAMPASGIGQRGCNDGSGATRITPEDVHARAPTWISGFIAFEQGKDSGDIAIVEDKGGGATFVVAPSAADDRNPAWASSDLALPAVRSPR